MGETNCTARSPAPHPPSGEGVAHADGGALDVAACPASVVAADETVPDADSAGEVVGPGTPEERCVEATLSHAPSCTAVQTIIATMALRLATMPNRRFSTPMGCIEARREPAVVCTKTLCRVTWARSAGHQGTRPRVSKPNVSVAAVSCRGAGIA